MRISLLLRITCFSTGQQTGQFKVHIRGSPSITKQQLFLGQQICSYQEILIDESFRVVELESSLPFECGGVDVHNKRVRLLVQPGESNNLIQT
jgi:hypothetical protein